MCASTTGRITALSYGKENIFRMLVNGHIDLTKQRSGSVITGTFALADVHGIILRVLFFHSQSM